MVIPEGWEEGHCMCMKHKDGKEGLPGFESWLCHWLDDFRHEFLHLSEPRNAKNGYANGACLS